MTAFEGLRIEDELKVFATKNFEKTSVCRNLDQIRFYTAELRLKISEYESRFNFAPVWAYGLLEKYTARQNSLEEIRNKTISH
jgi:hypothetical protein